MKKFTLALVLAAASIAAAGQITHGSNPMTLNGRTLRATPSVFPIPDCPPACGRDR